jgi:Zn-dependent protease
MFNLNPETLIARLITLMIAFTVHEFAHAFTADQLGDPTPRSHGRLTLNPIVHLDPIGTLMLLFAGFGWAKPVMIDPYILERRTPAGPMIVAAAGPFSNLVLAILAAIPIRAGLIDLFSESFLTVLFLEFIFINLILLLFNLIPIFPLDGEKILAYFLVGDARATLLNMRQYGPMLLLVLIMMGNFTPLDPLAFLIARPAQTIFSFLLL